LTALPEGQRELLELRTGFRAARPLSPRAAAARLHFAPARFARLEAQAVRELSYAGSTHSCRQTGAIVTSALSFIGAGLGGARHHGATGGVEAVRYSASPIKASTTKSSTLGRILGADIPPVASDLILVLLSLLAAGSVVAFVLADAAGQGPRHEQWRQRVINRFRSLR
jgi:hypothetical protein